MYIDKDIRWLYGCKPQRINNRIIPTEQSGKGVFEKLDSMLPTNVDVYHLDSHTTSYQGETNRFQGVFYNTITKKIVTCPFIIPSDSNSTYGSYTLYNV